MRRVLTVLNARAGTLLGMDAAEVMRQAQAALAPVAREVEVVLARGREIVRAIDRGAAEPYDALIVGGGDGSISRAAARLAGTEKVLGVLPLGTMNLLARDVGMPVSLDASLAALAHAEPCPIDVGVLNDRPFHTLSGVGFFSQMARAREETRDLPGKLLRTATAAIRAFSRAGRFTLTIAADGQVREIDCFAVLVTVNRFGDADWRRAALDGGMLEVHIVEDRGTLARLKAGADFVTGRWRENPGIHSVTAREVTIAAGRRRAWVSTDGELRRERVPLVYALRPRALRVLMPPPELKDTSPPSLVASSAASAWPAR